MRQSKDVLIFWDKNIFDGEKRLLPNSKKLYTQFYEDINSWSIVFEFEETARIQGYKSKAKAHFLVKEAPHSLFKEGFKFDFLDGRKKIGICEIRCNNHISMDDIQFKIDSIENLNKEFKSFINSIEVKGITYTKEELNQVLKYINDYPFLYKLVIKLDKNLAISYLNKYFFKLPVESNAVYHSNLPFFIFNLKNELGEEEFFNYKSKIPLEIINNQIIRNAFDELL